MALPPLELFSLEKRPPCCRVAFSFSPAYRFQHPRLYAWRERRYNPTRYVQQGRADVAQLVEQLIRNQQVIGSSPIVGSIQTYAFKHFLSLFLHRVWYRLIHCFFPSIACGRVRPLRIIATEAEV